VPSAALLSASAAGAQKNAAKAKVDAEIAWSDARNAREPAKVKLFRASLLPCSCVQIDVTSVLMKVFIRKVED
jgi:hypothetical protein